MKKKEIIIWPTLPATGFIRLREVLKLIPVSRTSFYEGISAGRYPSPVKLSKRSSAWRAEDILKLINDLGKGVIDCD